MRATNEYRLGDIICGFMHSGAAPENSIGKEYKLKTNKINDYNILDKIIKDRYKQFQHKPTNIDLIIHLRLGDVLENSKYSVDDYWNNKIELRSVGIDISPHIFYIKNKYFYTDILNKIKQFNIKNIILVTFFHRTKSNTKSIKYLNKVKNIFIDYNIIERINKDIDEDMVFCSRAHYFVPSGGGYSYIIVKILELNKKFIFNKETIHVHNGIYNGLWINSNSLKYYKDDNSKQIIINQINDPSVRGIWIPQETHKTIVPKLDFYNIEWSQETNIFYYDISIYNFTNLITNLYRTEFKNDCSLFEIHNYFDNEIINYYNKDIIFGKNDRNNKLIKRFHNYVDNNNEFINLYKLFIKNYIGKLFPDEEFIIYQKTPNIRFHIPNQTSIGKLETDINTDVIGINKESTFGHNLMELNIILPLTMMFNTNSIQFEKTPNSNIDFNKYESLTLDNNTISIIYLNQCLYYNKINKTNYTRVSLDFRIIPGSLYKPSNFKSITSLKQFIIGDYYEKIKTSTGY